MGGMNRNQNQDTRDRPVGTYAFVVPRYGAQVGGGAETLVRHLAERLVLRGDSVEIWTTCARDNRTWQNELNAGCTLEEGVTVHRFPVDDRDLERWVPLQIRIHEGLQLSSEEQLDWMQESVNSSELYQHILLHADEVDAIFFAPYLFGTTFWGSFLRPDRSILIPCLHNESYAYTAVIQSMFRGVRGCLFNALPEQELATALYGRCPGGEVGMGFDLFPPDTIASWPPYLDSPAPYIAYVGRKETGKNVHVLLDGFVTAKENGHIPADVQLVIAGGGSFSDLHRPEAIERSDVIDIGYLSEYEKNRLMRHALCVCQPSTNESFSIVLMEAWLVGAPVLVHADCAVTRHHVLQSGGGLYFSSPAELAGAVNYLLEHPAERNDMAAAGYRYVQQQYSWDAVIGRFDAITSAILEAE